MKDIDVLSKIWLYPEMVFRFVNHTGHRKFFAPLLIAASVLIGIKKLFTSTGANETILPSSLLVSSISGILFGWIFFYVCALFISSTGRWLSGKANTEQILLVMIYAQIPFVCSAIIYLLEFYFKHTGYLETAGHQVRQIVSESLSAAKYLVAIWTIILYVIGIAEAQNFSRGKAIINLILPFLVIGIPIYLVYLVMVIL